MENVYNLIIIGSGPAGLTAGIYASRAELSPLLIQGNNPGGQLMGTAEVENWPGNKSIMGPELMINMQEHAKHTGCKMLAQQITRVDFSAKPFRLWTDANQELKAHSIIIATGAGPRRLECPGEKEYWGKGVTGCAVCDGAFYRDKKVVVIGGGDTAMEDALFLTKFTNNITVIQNQSTLSASEATKKPVLNNKDISIIYSSTVTEFKGDGTKLTHVAIKDLETGKTREEAFDGAFLAIGMIPRTAPFKNALEIDSWGYLVVHDNTCTSIDGIFAAGDVHDYRYKQAIVASGNGCMAALDAERYLKKTLD